MITFWPIVIETLFSTTTYAIAKYTQTIRTIPYLYLHHTRKSPDNMAATQFPTHVLRNTSYNCF